MMRPLRINSLLPVLLVISLISAPVRAQQSDLSSLAGSNGDFGFELYQAVRETEGNLFLSPYSISEALAMTWAGARGRTEREMAEVLHFPAERSMLHRGFSGLRSCMSAIQEKGQVSLSTASSLWCQEGYRFLDSFFELAGTHYGAAVKTVDFAQRTEAARQAINSWVAGETGGKITELVERGILDPSTALVLCNAIYFRGDWACRFDAGLTRETDFRVSIDRTVKVPMMMQSALFRWAACDGFRALEIPYEGDDLAMIILLPERIEGLAGLERSLTGENVRGWLGELGGVQPSEIALLLPRFSTTGRFELAEILAAMGMPGAFHDADFSGMTGTRELFISDVVHKAFIDVNEEGTEAAASTAVTMKRGGAVFRVDRPFIFLIRENRTGSILFIGRITDPTR